MTEAEKKELREKLEIDLLRNPKFKKLVEAARSARGEKEDKNVAGDILDMVRAKLSELSVYAPQASPSDLLIKNTEAVYLLASSMDVIFKSLTDKNDLM